MTKNFELKIFFIHFFDQKLQFIYPLASLKDVQATGEALSSQREHPALQNMKILYFTKIAFVCLIVPAPLLSSCNLSVCCPIVPHCL